MYFITARIMKERGRFYFHRRLSVHSRGTRLHPIILPSTGTSIQCLMRGRGYPVQSLRGGGGIPARSGWGTSPVRDWMGVPQGRTGWGNQREIEQQSEYLLLGGLYASCFNCAVAFNLTSPVNMRTTTHG